MRQAVRGSRGRAALLGALCLAAVVITGESCGESGTVVLVTVEGLNNQAIELGVVVILDGSVRHPFPRRSVAGSLSVSQQFGVLLPAGLGGAVSIEVDAFPHHVFKGTIGSLSPGTGAQFAILPPQNATGNFVKVVQRVPVRIYFDSNDKYVRKLKAGMSAYTTIDTNHRRSLAALFGFSPAVAAKED